MTRDAWTKRVEEMQRKAATRIGGGASHQAWKERQAAAWNGNEPIELPIINEGSTSSSVEIKGGAVVSNATGHNSERIAAKPPPSTRTKFRNVKTDGYASKREATRAAELKLMERAGSIRNLREQVQFELIPSQEGERPCRYIADFVYERSPILPRPTEWDTIVEDTKGVKTADYIIKRKLMLFRHGIRISEV